MRRGEETRRGGDTTEVTAKIGVASWMVVNFACAHCPLAWVPPFLNAREHARGQGEQDVLAMQHVRATSVREEQSLCRLAVARMSLPRVPGSPGFSFFRSPQKHSETVSALLGIIRVACRDLPDLELDAARAAGISRRRWRFHNSAS